MKTVWITRAQPGAEVTAARVRALGCEPVVAPLLAVRQLPGAVLDLSDVGVLAFTSANGARAFAGRSGERDLPVFAVGEGTAAAARAAGFSRVESAHGDVAALATMIAARRLAGVVLHPGAVELADDLAGRLTKAGIKARTIAVYETIAQGPCAELLDRLETLDAALVHSPKAARALAVQLAQTPAPGLQILCLSSQIAQGVVGAAHGGVAIATFPTETALLSLLQV